MSLLLALGCLADLGTVWGESDPDYSAPVVDAVALDCEDGELELDAWVEGEVVAVTATV